MTYETSDINKDIIKKIERSNKTENVKNFILETLQFEYDNSSKAKPPFKDNYKKLVGKYKG